MMRPGRRGQKSPRPAAPAPSPWTIRPVSERVRREWEQATAAQPELMAALRERLRLRPLDRSDNPRRTHRLRPPLADKRVGDKTLPQWQRELTGGGRVFYCPDREERVVWVTRVDLAHPRETE